MPASLDEAKGSSTDEINAFTSELEEITATIEAVEPYDDQIKQLDEALKSLSDSIAQMAQVTNPSEKFVIERLTGLPNITGVQAATEDHDPNQQLNKQGGYTAAVFFSSDLVNKSKLYNKGDIVTVGTEGGGSVEVYTSVEDAEKREAYLGAFDGTVLSSGSHHVVGTCVVRVSTHLTGSQQKALQTSIVESLTRLD
jgi:vacuolar-type H+-ATPase subunit I/STV1